MGHQLFGYVESRRMASIDVTIGDDGPVLCGKTLRLGATCCTVRCVSLFADRGAVASCRWMVDVLRVIQRQTLCSVFSVVDRQTTHLCRRKPFCIRRSFTQQRKRLCCLQSEAFRHPLYCVFVVHPVLPCRRVLARLRHGIAGSVLRRLTHGTG